ncbi:hypothetical protein G6F47_001604 [Rhizopus delemar]|uniref:Tc1-like transposase DDE domain-containing protein n=1 Tax=Rhizopus oryzae TaxID=64495 RepID=A0A9P6Y7E6_RHIOR|nr:hypothetical protein G6F53_007600 [Rhizopus delemar]KAG1541138.1 hypothetical protein G6F51_008084 [Rhizopus arrhizus]KAG1593955.1 hypothetical protein G6F48_001683 [Rhizopus delemar]KAG1603683.1 hypothetical protein G6F47_001604 [Rhizopus delemar]KAG1627499.1 hypothetical protein G6F45_007615 [Rhizopus arrhizus]
MKPADAAKLANVNPETARKWKREYDNDPEKNIPFKKTNRTSKRAPSQLNESHKMHLINFFDENPSAAIQDAVENLTKSFEGLEIKKSRVAEFMKEECSLSLKVVTRHPKARNSQKNLEARANWVKQWQQKGLHFMKNCVFLDEAGFDVNMRRSRGWAQRGKPAIEETTSARGVSHTVIGAISAYGIVNVSLREPGNVKKRRVVGAKKRKAPEGVAAAIPKGTTTGHFVQFISDTLDIMDEFPKLERVSYLYLPPYSPELNPIEMFWKVLEDRVKRGKLTDAETLPSRIIEGSEDVPVEHLLSFIQHSINYRKYLDVVPVEEAGQKRKRLEFHSLLTSICEYLPNYQQTLKNLQNGEIEIIGYARKSPSPEDQETRVRLLNSMINNLRSRSLETRVYVSACSRSSTPFQERGLKNHEIYDELSNIDGDTQVFTIRKTRCLLGVS